MMHNERGIALIATLLVVALLTITVIDFTYSVEVDQHMARNAISGLQASLLARSGINYGEALLLHDQNTLGPVDAFTEDWCAERGHPIPGDRPRCEVDDFSVELPANMLLRVWILDESGKFNLNLVRPQNVTDCRALGNVLDPNPTTALQLRFKVLITLFEEYGVPPELIEAIQNYWNNVCTAVGANPSNQTPGQTPGQTASSAAVAPALQSEIARQLALQEFPSLDDAGAVSGLSPAIIQRLRPVLTAVRAIDLVPLPPNVQISNATALGVLAKVNVNTAPRQVLNAILSVNDNPGDCVDEIINERADGPLKVPPGCAAKGQSMLGVNSVLYRIRASAIVNPNPMTGLGGIRRTASMLVRRTQRPCGTQGQSQGPVCWTLTQLDWQKEGGAALFDQQTDQDAGGDEATGGPPS